jgi:hypothetical protein
MGSAPEEVIGCSASDNQDEMPTMACRRLARAARRVVAWGIRSRERMAARIDCARLV